MDAEFLLIAPIITAAIGFLVSVVYSFRRQKAEKLMVKSLITHKAIAKYMADLRLLNKEKHTGLDMSADDLAKLQKQLLNITNELDNQYRAQIVVALDQPSKMGRDNYMFNLVEEVKSISKVSKAT